MTFYITGNCPGRKHGPALTSTARLTSPWLAVSTASLLTPFNCISFAEIQAENSDILKSHRRFLVKGRNIRTVGIHFLFCTPSWKLNDPVRSGLRRHFSGDCSLKEPAAQGTGVGALLCSVTWQEEDGGQVELS